MKKSTLVLILIASLLAFLLNVVFFFSIKEIIIKGIANNLLSQAQSIQNFSDLQELLDNPKDSWWTQEIDLVLDEIKTTYSLEDLVLLDTAGNVLAGNQLLPLALNPSDLVSSEILIFPLKKIEGNYFISLLIPFSNYILYGSSGVNAFKNFLLLKRIYFIANGVLLSIIVLFSGIVLLIQRRLKEIQNKAKLQDQLSFMGKMAAMVAHEIKNPLAIIRSTAEVIKKSKGQVDAETFDYITEEVDRLSRTLNQFLSLGRDIAPAPVHHDLIRDLSDWIKPWADRIIAETPPVLDSKYDRDQIKQIIINLILNALEVTPPDQKIILRVIPNQRIKIQVEDRGTRITRAIQEKMFEPFFTTKKTGNGLGLAVSRLLAEKHSGRLYLLQSTTLGSIFVLELPLT